MDWFEALIMERATFSIDVSFEKVSPTSGNLKVSWSENPSNNDSFAGYEIYMVLQPWNEYGTYEVIAARYNLYSSSHFFNLNSSLGIASTKSITIPVSSSDLDDKLGGPGEYYVRVGIIAMEKKDKDSYYSASNPIEYEEHSSLEKISGYTPVDIY